MADRIEMLRLTSVSKKLQNIEPELLHAAMNDLIPMTLRVHRHGPIGRLHGAMVLLGPVEPEGHEHEGEREVKMFDLGRSWTTRGMALNAVTVYTGLLRERIDALQKARSEELGG